MRRQHRAGGHALARQRAGHARRDEIGVAFLVQMLELASPAGGEMDAGRLCMMDTESDTAIRPDPVARRRQREMPAIGRDAIAARGDADDAVGFAV